MPEPLADGPGAPGVAGLVVGVSAAVTGTPSLGALAGVCALVAAIPGVRALSGLPRRDDEVEVLRAQLARLEQTIDSLRAGSMEPDATLAAIEECARLATEASTQVDQRTRAALEPLPDLPGQLPLPAS